VEERLLHSRVPGARAIAEGALLADLTVLVVLMGLYIPYAGPALAALSPIPLLLLALRRGWRVTVEATVAACLLVSFLTGPFSAVAVVVVAMRSAALGIGLRRRWRVRYTVLAGSGFLWVAACAGVALLALVVPSWRSATEQGIRLTLRELSGLAGIVLRIVGRERWWQDLAPTRDGFITWFVAHWLLLLPVVVWPLMLITVSAEYVIAEVVLPRFGVTIPAFRFSHALGGVRPVGARERLRLRLEVRLAGLQAERAARSSRRRPEGGTGGKAGGDPKRVAIESSAVATEVDGRDVPAGVLDRLAVPVEETVRDR